MNICERGHTFEQGKLYGYIRSGDNAYPGDMGCPYCKADYEEAHICQDCGEYTESDIEECRHCNALQKKCLTDGDWVTPNLCAKCEHKCNNEG